jgi:protein TonB
MIALVGSQLLLIALVQLWPLTGEAPRASPVYRAGKQEVIEIDEIRPTRQTQALRPPPPAPLPPIVVPNDVLIEEELAFSDQLLPVDVPGTDAIRQEGDPEGGPPTGDAFTEVGPKPVRVVEPEYTREAQRKNVRAEVVVEVVVDERGRVSTARVLERYLLRDGDDPKERVAQLGYGLEESALSAAERWTFRPARQQGKAVRSAYTLVFSFGV